ncbi:MAG TPA: PPC domain-containing protein, partial [Pirellulales bacterium]|nr:PPC domain-containing protein [Pirellulales bacterium]
MATRVKLIGKHLAGLTNGRVVLAADKIVKIKLEPGKDSSGPRWAEITLPATTPRGRYPLALAAPQGSVKLMLDVDDLPQRSEQEPNDVPRSVAEQPLPATFWGTIAQPGDRDHFRFRGRTGQMIVLELTAAGIGSALNATLSLLDPDGEVIANNNDFDGRKDPLVAYRLPVDGVYTIRVQDQLISGSDKHFYQLSAGELPVVTGVFPMAIKVGSPCELELAGYNLPLGARVTLTPQQPGDLAVPIDAQKYRSLQAFRVLVSGENEVTEKEPNDQPQQAASVATPAHISGRLWSAGASGAPDADLFRFSAKRGQEWIVETMASRRGSPADTRIEVLDAAGKPLDRIWLQAVLDSYITFRPITSDANQARVQSWEEMRLNQYLYMQGEVVKLFRKPQGPDSGFVFYTDGGQRRCYFDTSSTAHPLDEPCYIVQPQPPGTKLLPTGLPVFKLGYANDDAGGRAMRTDSRLMFTAPADGDYLVRVTDTRGASGDRFNYRLSIRPPEPDFQVKLADPDSAIAAGDGVALNFQATRSDEFEGEIMIDVQNLPAGFSVAGPLTIEAGHDEARAALTAQPEAHAPSETDWGKVKITARAQIAGREVQHEVRGLGAKKLGPASKLRVYLEPAELDIVPGTTVSAKLRVERDGFSNRISFDVRNLPHGIVVDNIGL